MPNTLLMLEGEAVTVATTPGTTLLTTPTVSVHGYMGSCSFEIVNSGAAAINNLFLQVKDHPNGEWYTLLSGTDWTTLGAAALDFSSPTTGINILAAGATGHFRLNPGPFYGLRLVATVASTGTTLQARGIVWMH